MVFYYNRYLVPKYINCLSFSQESVISNFLIKTPIKCKPLAKLMFKVTKLHPIYCEFFNGQLVIRKKLTSKKAPAWATKTWLESGLFLQYLTYMEKFSACGSKRRRLRISDTKHTLYIMTFGILYLSLHHIITSGISFGSQTVFSHSISINQSHTGCI